MVGRWLAEKRFEPMNAPEDRNEKRRRAIENSHP